MFRFTFDKNRSDSTKWRSVSVPHTDQSKRTMFEFTFVRNRSNPITRILQWKGFTSVFRIEIYFNMKLKFGIRIEIDFNLKLKFGTVTLKCDF